MMARGLEPGCSRSHPVPQDPALAVQFCCLVCRAPGPGIPHVWLVSCQGDRVVSTDSCLPPPMPHRPLPLPIHPSVHLHATLHPLTVPFSISPWASNPFSSQLSPSLMRIQSLPFPSAFHGAVCSLRPRISPIPQDMRVVSLRRQPRSSGGERTVVCRELLPGGQPAHSPLCWALPPLKSPLLFP